MKGISLWQPHATWIALKWKTIETRDHDRFACLRGRRVAIHAAKKFDPGYSVFPKGRKATGLEFVKLYQWMRRCMGCIVCTAVICEIRRCPEVDFVEREEWERRACYDIRNKYLHFLEDIEPLKTPVPFRGRPWVFDVPDELILSPASLEAQR